MLEKEAINIIENILKYNNIKLSIHTVSITDSLNNILRVLNKYNSKDQIMQLIDEKIYYSEKQLKLAGVLALKSFSDGTNISTKPQIEYLLYLTATTQIKDSINKAGVKNKDQACLVIITTENKDHRRILADFMNNAKISLTRRDLIPDLRTIRKIYNINSNIPDNLLESIILTKIAVLDTYK